ncbi:MAG TPA: hypothetical protein VEK38_02880 [Candidatus Bathyarchaeia archaeon]|nr:hypothetical protein [Candidatus Bathyarchaeia archaeon]
MIYKKYICLVLYSFSSLSFSFDYVRRLSQYLCATNKKYETIVPDPHETAFAKALKSYDVETVQQLLCTIPPEKLSNIFEIYNPRAKNYATIIPRAYGRRALRLLYALSTWGLSLAYVITNAENGDIASSAQLAAISYKENFQFHNCSGIFNVQNASCIDGINTWTASPSTHFFNSFFYKQIIGPFVFSAGTCILMGEVIKTAQNVDGKRLYDKACKINDMIETKRKELPNTPYLAIGDIP